MASNCAERFFQRRDNPLPVDLLLAHQLHSQTSCGWTDECPATDHVVGSDRSHGNRHTTLIGNGVQGFGLRVTASQLHRMRNARDFE